MYPPSADTDDRAKRSQLPGQLGASSGELLESAASRPIARSLTSETNAALTAVARPLRPAACDARRAFSANFTNALPDLDDDRIAAPEPGRRARVTAHRIDTESLLAAVVHPRIFPWSIRSIRYRRPHPAEPAASTEDGTLGQFSGLGAYDLSRTRST